MLEEKRKKSEDQAVKSALFPKIRFFPPLDIQYPIWIWILDIQYGKKPTPKFSTPKPTPK